MWLYVIADKALEANNNADEVVADELGQIKRRSRRNPQLTITTAIHCDTSATKNLYVMMDSTSSKESPADLVHCEKQQLRKDRDIGDKAGTCYGKYCTKLCMQSVLKYS